VAARIVLVIVGDPVLRCQLSRWPVEVEHVCQRCQYTEITNRSGVRNVYICGPSSKLRRLTCLDLKVSLAAATDLNRMPQAGVAGRVKKPDLPGN
jgi:hypothetical protein